MSRAVRWFLVFMAGGITGFAAGVAVAAWLARTQPDNVLAGTALGFGGVAIGFGIGAFIATRAYGNPMDYP